MIRRNSQSQASVEEAQKHLPKAVRNGKKNVPKIAKVTLYVRSDQVIAIEDIQLQQRKQTGSRPDKSSLVQEALDLLIAKYS